MWMNVKTFCFIIIFYVAAEMKKKPWPILYEPSLLVQIV
jgi:hypothetical protein